MNIYYCHKVKHIFLCDPNFRSNEKNEFWGFIRHVHLYIGYQLWISSISFIHICPWTGSLRHSTVQELIYKNEFLLLLSHGIVNLQRRKRTECVKLPLERWYETRWHCQVINMSQSFVSRPLKEHRERLAVLEKKKRSTLILEYKELLIKHYGTCCIIWRPHAIVKGGYWDFERSKAPGQNPGIWY